MIQKSSILNVADSCGVWTVNTFHIYRGFRHKLGKFGDFLKVSVRHTKPAAWLKKGKKSKAILVRTSFKHLRRDGSYIKTLLNSCVLLKKRVSPRGKEIEGFLFYGMRRKKLRSSFAGIF
uniref:50S ribosomal protein L14 n=1 Tax=Paramecium gigas TaxID=2709424 RepID=UPI001D019E5D|nr:50S ribosomal protein L14 [Paramecium gigas]QVG61499.1 50S ribosomal protein L14 [Paramecium gigas]